MVLDLAEPWKVKTIRQNIKPGGYVVAYLPQVSQVMDFSKFLEKNNFLVDRIVEVQEREWAVKERISRPKSQAIGHTAFLVFARQL